MRAKPESTIISWKLRTNNLIGKSVRKNILSKVFDNLFVINSRKNCAEKIAISLLVIYGSTDSEYRNRSQCSICTRNQLLPVIVPCVVCGSYPLL